MNDTMPDAAQILKDALNLPVKDRAALADKLLASLDDLSEEEAERLWADEAHRRLEEYRGGRATAVPADDVARKVGQVLR
jgi:putative addiction module component (TIGR02574 family)